MNAGYDVTTSAPQLVKALQLVANGPEHNVIRGLARLNKKWHIAALKQHHDTMKVAKIDPFVKWTTVQKARSRATLTAWSRVIARAGSRLYQGGWPPIDGKRRSDCTWT